MVAEDIASKGATARGKRQVGLENAVAIWPTPVAQDDNKTAEAHLAMKQRMGERDGTNANRTTITSLAVASSVWPTPRSSPNENRGTRGYGRTGGKALSEVTSQWATPKTNSGDYQYANGNHEKPVLNLHGQVKQWATPVLGDSDKGPIHYARGNPGLSLQARTMPKPGLISSRTAPASPPRLLNPRFVEWLMGWPRGSTVCDCSGMASSPSRPRTPSTSARRLLD